MKTDNYSPEAAAKVLDEPVEGTALATVPQAADAPAPVAAPLPATTPDVLASSPAPAPVAPPAPGNQPAPGVLFFGGNEKPGQNMPPHTASTVQPEATQAPDFSWASYFQAIGVLFLLLGLLWVGLHLLRRHGGSRFLPQSMSRNALRVEAQLALGPRKSVYVVRFLNKRLVLGVTDQNINLLTETEVRDEQATAEFDTTGSNPSDGAAGPASARGGKSG